MKLLSYARGGEESWGAVTDDGIVDLARVAPSCPTLADFIASPHFAARDRLLAGAPGPVIALDQIRYLPVIPRPEKIVCVLRNYHEPSRPSSCGCGARRWGIWSRSSDPVSRRSSISRASWRW